MRTRNHVLKIQNKEFLVIKVSPLVTIRKKTRMHLSDK